MTAKAKVTLVNGQLMAEVIRSEACAKCGQCQHGRSQSQFYPLPKGHYRAGDEIELTLPDDAAFPAALLAYGVPLGALMAGLLVSAALGIGQIWQAVIALLSAAAGYLILKALEPRIHKSGRFTPKCPHEDGNEQGG